MVSIKVDTVKNSIGGVSFQEMKITGWKLTTGTERRINHTNNENSEKKTNETFFDSLFSIHTHDSIHNFPFQVDIR